jgi:hypothetical protein
VPRGTQEPLKVRLHFSIRGCHPLWPTFPGRSHNAFYTSFNHEDSARLLSLHLRNYCGPTTPRSPCESRGLGYSEFARHYYRNHGCFLFLWVLRWFTSPGSLPAPIYSAQDIGCPHPMGSPIRKSPDHRLLASPRGLSQLATSFFACLRQGIHTHALSSLTIKLTPHTTTLREVLLLALLSPNPFRKRPGRTCCYPSDIQLSKITKTVSKLLLAQPSAHVTNSALTDE